MIRSSAMRRICQKSLRPSKVSWCQPLGPWHHLTAWAQRTGQWPCSIRKTFKASRRWSLVRGAASPICHRGSLACQPQPGPALFSPWDSGQFLSTAPLVLLAPRASVHNQPFVGCPCLPLRMAQCLGSPCGEWTFVSQPPWGEGEAGGCRVSDCWILAAWDEKKRGLGAHVGKRGT